MSRDRAAVARMAATGDPYTLALRRVREERAVAPLPTDQTNRGCVPGHALVAEVVAAGTCVFCQIVKGYEPATIVRQWQQGIAIVPLNPVAAGHLLVIPHAHVRDAAESPHIAGLAMSYAAEIARAPFNIITSAGREATQSVFHLHLHVVPRAEDDGLALPWYSGKRRKAAAP